MTMKRLPAATDFATYRRRLSPAAPVTGYNGYHGYDGDGKGSDGDDGDDGDGNHDGGNQPPL